MKKILCVTFAVLMVFVLMSGCGKKKVKSEPESFFPLPDSSLDSSSVSTADENHVKPDEMLDSSDNMPEIIIDRNPYPGATAIGGHELELRMYALAADEEPPLIILSLQQQNALVNELQTLIAQYESGEYPLQPSVENTEDGFYTGWPKDVGFPQILPVSQMIYTTVGHEVYVMSVQFPLPKGWFMECALVVDAQDVTKIDYSSEDNVWIPVTAYFIDPNGLVFDQPGESENSGNITIAP